MTKTFRQIVARHNPLLNLVCFHHAGGGASAYQALARNLPSFVNVWLTQLPGRENRFMEPRFRDFEVMLTALQQDILDISLTLPTIFFGHSMGALISYALARRLPEVPLNGLAVSGRCAPDDNPRKALKPALEMKNHDVIAMMRSMGGTDKKVFDTPELLDLAVEILHADLILHESYAHQPGNTLNIPIWVAGGADDYYVSRVCLSGWQAHTRQDCTVKIYPGNHFYLLQGNQTAFIQDLTDFLIRIKNDSVQGT